jgi:competence protein ComEC
MAAPSTTSPFRTSVATRQPLLYAALAFAAGIVAGPYAWRPPVWFLIAIAAFTASSAYWARTRGCVARGLALSVLFWLGAFSIQVRPPATLPNIADFTDGRELLVTGHVSKGGSLRDDGFGTSRQTLDVQTEQIMLEEVPSNKEFGLRLVLYSPASQKDASGAAKALHVYRYGDRIRVRAKLRVPRNFRNPGAFDYRSYLAEQRIAALGTAKASEVDVLPGFVGSQFELWREDIRDSLVQKIHTLWSPQQAALLDAMVIGDDGFISRDTRVDFQRSGTYHILVVSGMNLSILAFIVFLALRRMRANEGVATALTILLSVAYALITDVGAPIWRAVLMLTIFLGTRLMYRQRSMLNTVGGAALGLLALDPNALFAASFQMTCLSVLIIAGIGVPILERSSQPYRRGLWHLESTGYDISLPARVTQFRLDLRMIAQRLARFLGGWLPLRMLALLTRVILSSSEVLTISLLMQLGLALPMAWYFHRATLMGISANLLAIPLTEALMPSAVIAVSVGYFSMRAARLPAVLTAVALRGITGTVRWVGGFGIVDWRVPTPHLSVALFAIIALTLVITLARRRAWMVWSSLAVLSASSLLIAIHGASPHLNPGVFEFTAIDVGQSDSSLLVTPEGRTILVDAGGPLGFVHSEFDIGEEVVSPYLWSRGLSRLDVVVLTHAHSDHIGGMRAILSNFKPHELWLGAMPDTEAVASLLRQAGAQGILVRRPRQGDAFSFGGVTARVLSPPREWVPGNQPQNDDSLILQFVYRNSAVLMEGDAEKASERRIVDFHPRSDLWKIAHNGSRTSTSPDLVSEVRPRIAVISVGARNTFGHPRPEVLERLAGAGASVYRTDVNGAVSFYLNGNSISSQVAALH